MQPSSLVPFNTSHNTSVWLPNQPSMNGQRWPRFLTSFGPSGQHWPGFLPHSVWQRPRTRGHWAPSPDRRQHQKSRREFFQWFPRRESDSAALFSENGRTAMSVMPTVPNLTQPPYLTLPEPNVPHPTIPCHTNPYPTPLPYPTRTQRTPPHHTMPYQCLPNPLTLPEPIIPHLSRTHPIPSNPNLSGLPPNWVPIYRERLSQTVVAS